MKTKIFWLTTISLIVFFSLSAIQSYLIYNSYILKKNSFIIKNKELIIDLKNNEKLSKIEELWSSNLKNKITEYKNKKIEKNSLVKLLRFEADSINRTYLKIFKEELKKKKINYSLNYKKNIKSIIIIGTINDTLFPINNSGKFKLFGYSNKIDNDNLISTTRTFSEYEYIDDTNKLKTVNKYNVEIITQDIANVSNEKKIIFNEIYELLLGSFFIFMSMVFLFYYSLKTLIKQKEIDEFKTDFINNITHELKTPLATLDIAIKSLKNRKIINDHKATINTLEIIDRQNLRIQNLIDQVINNSLESKNIVLKTNPIIVQDYLKEIINDFQIVFSKKNIMLTTDLYSIDSFLNIDSFYFTNAVLNILENAVKYSLETINIEIKTTVKGNDCLIIIKDQGIGIPKKEIKNIFNKFHRVSKGDKYLQKSLGLGLYYTEQIIKAHKGYIYVKSELGKGSSFIITIPIIS